MKQADKTRTTFHAYKESNKQKSLKQIHRIQRYIAKIKDEKEEKIREKKIKEEQETKDILSLDEYIKEVILSYQSRYTDVKISQKLGISRKNLWEKRKKFGLEKKKLVTP